MKWLIRGYFLSAGYVRARGHINGDKNYSLEVADIVCPSTNNYIDKQKIKG